MTAPAAPRRASQGESTGRAALSDWAGLVDVPPDSGTQARLHAMLLRAARAETHRRSSRTPVGGAELDDVAHQAAADAMVSILRKIDTFRGESRFTTWAYRFVILEVSSKLGRHYWNHAPDVLDGAAWERLPDRFGLTPEQAVQGTDLFAAARRAVEDGLTDRQRDVFVAVVVDGVPLDALCARTGLARNAVYKTVFDARRKIRAILVADGYLDPTPDR